MKSQTAESGRPNGDWATTSDDKLSLGRFGGLHDRPVSVETYASLGRAHMKPVGQGRTCTKTNISCRERPLG